MGVLRCVVVLLLPALVLLGCGGDDGPPADAGSGPALDGGGVDLGEPLDSGALDAGAWRCGPEPHVRVVGGIFSFTTMAPVAGGRLTVDLCPELVAVTDEAGGTEGRIARGVPFNFRVEARGYVTMRTGELLLRDDFEAQDPLFPSLLSALLPHWSEDRPTVLVLVFAGEAAGEPDTGVGDAGPPSACDTREGAIFGVEGHPEAVVTYYSGTSSAPMADPALTATTELGVAEISGLEATAPGARVTLTVSKPGCDSITFASYPHTGRYVLENGVLTAAAAFLRPIAPP